MRSRATTGAKATRRSVIMRSYSNTTGSLKQTANGYGALLYNTTGNNNTATGVNAL